MFKMHVEHRNVCSTQTCHHIYDKSLRGKCLLPLLKSSCSTQQDTIYNTEAYTESCVPLLLCSVTSVKIDLGMAWWHQPLIPAVRKQEGKVEDLCEL